MLVPNARIVNKYEVITMAGVVFSECDGENSYSPKEWIEYNDIDYIKKAMKPIKEHFCMIIYQQSMRNT